MGKNLTAYEVEHDRNIFIFLVLSLLAHIRVLIFDELDIRFNGIILYSMSHQVITRMQHVFERLSGFVEKLRGSKIPEAENFRLIYVLHSKRYQEETIEDFLTTDQYLPVLGVSGIIPKELRQFGEVFCIDSVNEAEVDLGEVRDICDQIIGYIHQNPEYIISCMKEVYTHANLSYDRDEMLKCALLATAIAYNHCCIALGFTSYDIEHYQRIIDSLCKTVCSEDCENEDSDVELEIESVVRVCLERHVEKNQQLLMGDVDCVDKDLWEAVRNEQAILYSDDFYYIPNMVLEEATQHLHRGNPELSFLKIKRLMYEIGVLLCNDVHHNYTIKKDVLNPYTGKKERGRFLKVQRSALDAPGRLTLEERGGFRCTSVIAKENVCM